MKKTKLTRSLLMAVSVVALSAVMYGCVHSGGDSTPTLTKDEVTATGGATIKAGTTRLDGALADAFGGVSDDELDSLDREYATGETVTLAGYVLTCVSGPCRVTINANDTITTTGTIGVMAYVAPQPVDSDGDGVADDMDAFPDDPMETADSDGDGVGDNADAFPDDATETVDSDGDGVGDNADAFPDDPMETADSDDDGVGDNADVFPDDATEWADSDGDGIGDNADPHNVRDDRDNDGVADSGDDFPDDPTETRDSDGDGVGDNADDLPNDPTETADSDGDGVGDKADAFPNDPTETADSDGDGVGDKADAFPNDPTETADSDGDGVGNNAQAQAAANKVAGTKKKAITAEAAGSTIRPFDSNTAYSAGNAASNYGVTVEHTGSAVEVTVADAHADYDAKNDPKFSKTVSLGNGQMLVRNDGTDREIIVLYTDIEAPEDVRFGTTRSGYSLNRDVDTDTSANDSYLVVNDTDGKKLGGSRIVGPDVGDTKSLSQWQATGDNAKNVYSGTLDGVTGKFRCQVSACVVTTGADGAHTLTGTLWFTPDAGATVSIQDADYLTYGFWLDTTTKDGAITSYDAVQTFATSSLTATDESLDNVTGTATYEGDAVGVYFHESKNDDGSPDAATSGRFTADVSLTADFDGSASRTVNSIAGTISNFDLDGGPDNSWKVDVAAGISSDSWALQNGTAAGGGAAGSIIGQFHGTAVDRDGAGVETDLAAPPVLVGEFNANFTNGMAAGAYGARKQ